MDRLDKIISEAGVCSRRDCERLARRGLITVDGQVVKNTSEKVSDTAIIEIDGEPVARRREVVLIMNKPAGFVTSTDDDRNPTVMELLSEEMLRQKVVPAGRLDKDTEGLLVFTNNGELLHKLISPKHEVPKVYYVEHEGDVTEETVGKAAEGIQLKDGTVCKSAVIERLEEGKSTVCICEGMYHQVKRMYAALGLHVNYLRRIQIGGVKLGDLEVSKVRELTEEEKRALFNP
ncbi:MAG: rRNA pseudouridine synthase [Spirochaetales bacterium]|nr:rRNA pseudouridine synthase [Spirochaetales bacterium]